MKDNKIIIVKKKHENVFKNWRRPNFLLQPPKYGGTRKFARGGGGGTAAPPSPHGLYAPLNETKKDKLFFKQLRSSYLLGWGKNISLS